MAELSKTRIALEIAVVSTVGVIASCIISTLYQRHQWATEMGLEDHKIDPFEFIKHIPPYALLHLCLPLGWIWVACMICSIKNENRKCYFLVAASALLVGAFIPNTHWFFTIT